jgi:hypothetical protein
VPARFVAAWRVCLPTRERGALTTTSIVVGRSAARWSCRRRSRRSIGRRIPRHNLREDELEPGPMCWISPSVAPSTSAAYRSSQRRHAGQRGATDRWRRRLRGRCAEVRRPRGAPALCSPCGLRVEERLGDTAARPSNTCSLSRLLGSRRSGWVCRCGPTSGARSGGIASGGACDERDCSCTGTCRLSVGTSFAQVLPAGVYRLWEDSPVRRGRPKEDGRPQSAPKGDKSEGCGRPVPGSGAWAA